MHSWKVCCSLVVILGACSASPKITEEAAQAARAACTFKAGDLAEKTLASDAPRGARIPIDHVLLVMQENHSFDSIFSKLRNGSQVAPDGVTNPDADGKPVLREHQTVMCTNDPGHSWNASHSEWANGKNDGFVTTSGKFSLDYWDDTDLPYYYALAQTFAMSDSHFCSLLGPTSPNRMFSLAGTSFGQHFNTLAPEADANGNAYPNLFSELDRVGASWKYYSDTALPEGAFFAGYYLSHNEHFRPVSEFMTDAAAGQLPAFAIVEPKTTDNGDNEDEHPPGDIQVGQRFTARVVKALMESPNWPRSALFFTYDEHGGYYDSVPPPTACAPDDLPAVASQGDMPGGFDRLGFRVPMIVVSPYAKRQHVSHHVTDHASILRFVEARFDLPAMTRRDANADPMFDLFDFSHADTSIPTLPEAVVDQAKYDDCLARYPPK